MAQSHARTFGLAVFSAACWLAMSQATSAEGLPETIDRQIEAGCATAGVTPAPLADNATFLRRASLDLIGRVPTPEEVRSFLEDDRADKRARRVASLIASPDHVREMAVFWRRTWVPPADTEAMSHVAEELDGWIGRRLSRHDGLDAIVRDLIGASDLPVVGGTQEDAAPAGFLVANELKPENLAASTARAFLGLNLACAQCHDHPFAEWSRDQFWGMAAFFTRADTAGAKPASRPVVRVGDTNRSVAAQPPDGDELSWPDHGNSTTARRVLAGWVTSRANPWFARQLVNQLWSHFFGDGLVGPFDDPAVENPVATVALLDELTREFAATGFDLERLTTAIVLSKTYQRAVGGTTGTTAGRRLFASAMVRNLSGDQLHDSLRTAAGFPVIGGEEASESVRRERRQFAAGFQVARPATDARTVLQALTLMNGTLSTLATTANLAPTLIALQAPIFDDEERVQTLFLATLGRPARADELKAMAGHVATGGPDHDVQKALADVFWALINSSEFNTNH